MTNNNSYSQSSYEDITHNQSSPLMNFKDTLNSVNDTSNGWLDLLKRTNNTVICINQCAKFVIGNNIVTLCSDILTTQVDSLIANGTSALTYSTIITQVLNPILPNSTTDVESSAPITGSETTDNNMLQYKEDIHNQSSPLNNFRDTLSGVNDTSKNLLDLLKSGNNIAGYINQGVKFVIGNNIITFSVDCLTTQVNSLITNGTIIVDGSTSFCNIIPIQGSATAASTAKSEMPAADNYYNTDSMKKSATDSQDTQENTSNSYLNSIWNWSSKAMTWFSSGSAEEQIPTTALTEHNDEILSSLTEMDKSDEIVR